MFPVDALHGLIRHTVAHHRRETIAFGRRLNALMERLFLTVVWKNFVKGRSERRPDPVTPAMRLGLAIEPWTWRRVLSRRLFPARETLPQVWRNLYRRDWTTPSSTPTPAIVSPTHTDARSSSGPEPSCTESRPDARLASPHPLESTSCAPP